MDVPLARRRGCDLLRRAPGALALLIALVAGCGGAKQDEPSGTAAAATEGGEPEPSHSLGSARRPDPTAWVPAPEGEGAPAPTGEVTAVAPGGPHAAVRAAYVDFIRRVLAGDWSGLAELLAPQVGMMSRPQTIDRNDVLRRIRQRVDRMQLGGARVEDVLEPREIRVRALDQETRTTGITPGDLLVSASPRLPGQRSPFGSFDDDSPQISLVFHREEGRWVIVAGDF